MSPIYNLPVELLSRIFTLGMPEEHYPDFPNSDDVPFEMLVSHVCHHWRTVAIRTHHLWSTLHFRLVLHLERAQEYIIRSQPCLLDILVDTCAADEYRPGINLFRDEFRPVFAMTTPHIQRWRSLSLKVRDSGCKMGAREVLSNCGGAPHLEYLQLWHIENWESPERLYTQIGPPPVVVFNKHLPALKHIVLIGVNVPWPQSPFLQDLSTVEFALHSEHVRIPYDNWAHMLSTSPNLHKLSLHYSGPRSDPDGWPPGVIELPGLRELNLTDLDCGYLLQLFQRLSVPNVVRLRIELNDRDQDFSELFDFFASPAAHSGVHTIGDQDQEQEETTTTTPRGPMFPALESLTIAALDCSPESFRAFLQSTPSVRHLELYGSKMSPGLFQQLFTCSGPSTSTTRSSHGGGKGKGKQRASRAPMERDEEQEKGGYSYDVRRSGSARASSSDTHRSDESSTGTLSTAATSPRSVHAPLDASSSASGSQTLSTSSSTSGPRTAAGARAARGATSGGCMLLPALRTLRVSGVSGAQLGTLVRFRERWGRPVGRWYVNERMRDEGLERLAGELGVDIEDNDEDNDDDDDDYSEVEGEEEDYDDLEEEGRAGEGVWRRRERRRQRWVWFEGDDDEDDGESEGETDDGQRAGVVGSEPWGMEEDYEEYEEEEEEDDTI
jgi:hypothetical protein